MPTSIKERFYRIPAPVRGLGGAVLGLLLVTTYASSRPKDEPGCTGSVAEQALIRTVRDSLNDPGSFDLDHTQVSNEPVADGSMHMLMTFRAKNGFGALVKKTASAHYDPKTCAISQWTLI